MIKSISILLILVAACQCMILNNGNNILQSRSSTGLALSRHQGHREPSVRVRALGDDANNNDEGQDDFWVKFEQIRLEKMRKSLEKALNVPGQADLLPKPQPPPVLKIDKTRQRRERVPDNMPSFQWRTINSMVTFNVLTNSTNYPEQMKQFDELEFFLCPADMTWHDYASDTGTFQFNGLRDEGCIKLPSPAETNKYSTTVYDRVDLTGVGSRKFAWMARMRFEQLDVTEPSPKQLDREFRWTIVTVVKYKPTKRSAEKKMFIPSPTVRLVEQNDYFFKLVFMQDDLAESHRLAALTKPVTYQDAIDILRPLAYRIRNIRSDYASRLEDNVIKGIEFMDSRVHKDATKKAALRLQEAIEIVEDYHDRKPKNRQ